MLELAKMACRGDNTVAYFTRASMMRQKRFCNMAGFHVENLNFIVIGPALLTNIRLGYNGLSGESTAPYLTSVSDESKKGFQH